MPTEADPTPIARAQEIDSSTSLHATCPPEEQIQSHAPREEQIDGPLPDASPSEPRIVDDRHETIQQRTETEESDVSAGVEDSRLPQDKREVDAEETTDFSSPIGSPESSGDSSDGKLARSMGAAVLERGRSSPRARGGVREESLDGPRYLSYPSLTGRQKLSPNSTTTFLHSGSRFRGTQQSDRQVYDVQVEIKDVDLAESFLCGYLKIQGLTDDHPTLTTFFTGEIVGPRYTFRTQHPSWNSSEKIDLQHWSRFPAFKPLARSLTSAHKATVTSSTTTSSTNNPSGIPQPTPSSAAAATIDTPLPNFLSQDHLFMRWKEYFLVPDHRVKSISGASFEGFYYICFNQREGSVSGIYFHAKSEKFQQLELNWVRDGGCTGATEFR